MADITATVEELEECFTVVNDSLAALTEAVNDAGDELVLDAAQTKLVDEVKNQVEKATTALYIAEQLMERLDMD